MPVLVICKFNEDTLKTEGAINNSTTKYFDCEWRVTPKQIVRSDLYGYHCRGRFYWCRCYLQISGKSDQNEGAIVLITFKTFFPVLKGKSL